MKTIKRIIVVLVMTSILAPATASFAGNLFFAATIVDEVRKVIKAKERVKELPDTSWLTDSNDNSPVASANEEALQNEENVKKQAKISPEQMEKFQKVLALTRDR